MPTSNPVKKNLAYALVIVCLFVVAVAAAVWFTPSEKMTFSSTSIAATTTAATTTPSTPALFVVTHIPTPKSVRAAYFTSWAAGTPSFQKQMFSLLSASGTQLNAVVIDIKDYSGRIGYAVDDPRFKDPSIDAIGSAQVRIPDIEQFLASLHARHIYVIGRIQDFEDPFALKTHPEWYVKKANGTLWKDAGGAYWIDPDNKSAWSYLVAIAKQGYDVGFDEINFDYVRFPSDGSVNAAVYDLPASTTKAEAITSFFSYLHGQLSPLGIPTSADIFGQVTSDTGDMGIGQHFEDVLPYFDFVDPMVYPSHYIDGFDGYQNPAAHPYEIVKFAMDHAVARAVAASSTPSKVRPWLQGFDLGAVYTPNMLEAQIQATADAGLGSWLVWNAASVYTRYASLFSEQSVIVSPIKPIISTSTVIYATTSVMAVSKK
ncbi:MAG: putative glycoside hydrolase [Candidatus Pacebacteria bacterium]|nr:putative glycoside hydrolase [Candidatus Paceibacterota bacterium]